MPDFSELSDPQLVVAVGRYEEEALAEVYRRHAGPVFGLARRVLADNSDAEEVTQDVFVRLWRYPDKFDAQRGTLRNYLLTLVHGRAVDVARSSSSRRRREERETRRSAIAGYDLEHEVWDLDRASQVRDALTSLTAAERRAIELAYFGGHTYREVAEMLAEPEGTIKGRIRSGLQRMRVSLERGGAAR